MKEIFIEIQNRLAEVSELKYIDKNWNQLKFDTPPVKYPCALIDLSNVQFRQMGRLAQSAEADIEITIADKRLVNSSLKASRRQDSYSVFALIESIHKVIHGWHGDSFQPLIRTSIHKDYSDNSHEVYRVVYHTAFTVAGDDEEQTVKASVRIEI